MEESVCIKVKVSTREKLRSLKITKGETFEDVILRLTGITTRDELVDLVSKKLEKHLEKKYRQIYPGGD